MRSGLMLRGWGLPGGTDGVALAKGLAHFELRGVISAGEPFESRELEYRRLL